jgi:hypothetical protein
MTANDEARRRFIDAVIELSDAATPDNILRYLRASAALEPGRADAPPPGPPQDSA